MATTNTSGALTAATTTGPFGEPISGQPKPNNTSPGATYSYVGQHQKLTETSFVLTATQMGARVYLPELGRFAQVDPIEGGTENNYVYPTDPVNEFDLTGEAGSAGEYAIQGVIWAAKTCSQMFGASWCAKEAFRYACGSSSAEIAMCFVPGGLYAKGPKIATKATTAVKAAKTVQRVLSINQINKAIQTGKAPRSIIRADVGKVKGELPHIHFKGGHALNNNGTWKHGGRKLTNAEVKYLKSIGWKLPK